MNTVTKEMLDNLSKKIFISCVCIENDDKQLLEINTDIERMNWVIKLIEGDIKKKELEYKELNEASEIKKTSVYEDQLKLNRMETNFEWQWVNEWKASMANTGEVPTEIIANDNDSVSMSEKDDIEEDAPSLVDNVVEEVPSHSAALIKTLDKKHLEMNWPYTRVKNTIKYINSSRIGNPISSGRVSYYNGLQILAKYKGIHINQLVKMTLRQFIGSNEGTETIVGKYYDWRN